MSQPSSAPYPASTGDVTATTVAAMAPTTAAPVTCHSARTERGRLCSGRSPACAWTPPVSSDDVMGGGVPGRDPGPPDRGPGWGWGREEAPKRYPALSADGTWAGWFDLLLGLSFAAEDPHAYRSTPRDRRPGPATGSRLLRSGRREAGGRGGRRVAHQVGHRGEPDALRGDLLQHRRQGLHLHLAAGGEHPGGRGVRGEGAGADAVVQVDDVSGLDVVDEVLSHGGGGGDSRRPALDRPHVGVVAEFGADPQRVSGEFPARRPEADERRVREVLDLRLAAEDLLANLR